MTPEIAVVVVGVVVLAFLALRRVQAPKAGTERLAVTVWASFGPYESADAAADSLRWACCAIFGKSETSKHEVWMDGHIKNFRKWEAEGHFQQAEKVMRSGLLLTAYGPAFDAACKQFREELRARALEGTEWLNKEFLEKGGHKLEAVTQPDGTIQFAYKQIWSDEEFVRQKREDNEAILNAVGRNIMNDESSEAKQLLTFLSAAYRANAGKDLETPKDVGTIWFACLSAENEDPDSEVARTFKTLSDAWNATKSDRKV